jgi:hypothetical protein
MGNVSDLPANETAERLVRHLQVAGFAGIKEALILRIRPRTTDRAEIDAAFTRAASQQKAPPVGECFQIRPCGFFSGYRSFQEARAAIGNDFSVDLRCEIPRIFFEPAPVVACHPLATDTRYDAIAKLCDNIDGCALVVLINDPESSLFEYLGTHHGNDWEQIMGEFESAAVSFGPDIDLP